MDHVAEIVMAVDAGVVEERVQVLFNASDDHVGVHSQYGDERRISIGE